MPRRPRFVCEGEGHHVTQRGNYQQNIFENNEDFRKYSYLIAEYAPKYDITIWAYCLMNNHVHFVVTPKTKVKFSLFFNVVHMRYSQYKNLNKKKKGHLWQGRFFSSVLDERYLLSTVRYVEQNPVRARMVNKAWDYVWSSARAHVNQDKGDIIKIGSGSRILKMSGKASWNKYLEEYDKEENEIIRNKTLKGGVLGGEEFIDALECKTGIILRSRKVGRPRK